MYFLFYIFWIEEEFIVPHERRDIFAVMNHVSFQSSTIRPFLGGVQVVVLFILKPLKKRMYFCDTSA